MQKNISSIFQNWGNQQLDSQNLLLEEGRIYRFQYQRIVKVSHRLPS